MKMKIILAFIAAASLATTRPQYVTTIHPFQRILAAIVAERGEVHKLLPAGASPHTYELRPSEVRKVESATALFYGAANLDGWALGFGKARRIELLALVPAEHRLPLRDPLAADQRESFGTDPHFWTDPLVVKAMLPALTDTLCTLDPSACELYRRNSAAFVEHLDSLANRIQSLLAPVQDKGTPVMLSHQFFQYYFERFGIRVAGIIEPVPGKEPTPRDIKRLIERVEREQIKAIFNLPQHSSRPAELIAEATGIAIYELDPIGGVAGRESYDQILLYNTRIILEALR